MRPHLAAQNALVRMLFDPELAQAVRRDPAAALPELPSTLRAQLAAVDPRALKLDRLLGRRVLRTLFDEFKASTTLYLARTRKLASLDQFYRSRAFHAAISDGRPLAFAYAEFIDALPIERALAEARRYLTPPRDGRVHRAPGVVPVATTQGSLATLQQCEQYLFEVGMMPALALCDDAPPLALDARTRDQGPLYLVTVPTETGGHSLVTIDEATWALISALPQPPSRGLQPLVDHEIAVQT